EPPSGRHRNQDDPPAKEHEQHDRIEGYFGRARTEYLSRHGEDSEKRDRRAQLHAMRFAADWRQVWRAHFSLYRGQEFHGSHGARGLHVKDWRGPTLLPATAWT